MAMECRKIEDVCKCQSEVLASKKIYLVDHKAIDNSGCLKAYDEEPEFAALLLENPDQTLIDLVAFEDNAFEVKKGNPEKQCECTLYPVASDFSSWLLFVELKYAKNEFNIQREGWHKKAVEQIRSTVNFLRLRGAIVGGRKMNAIISFPLISAYSSWLADYVRNELKADGINARCTNKATIVDDKVLILA